MDPILRVTVQLVNGEEIVEELNDADIGPLLERKRHRYRIDPDLSDRETARRMVYTELAYRLSSGSGHVGLFDTGRVHWMIPPGAVMAIKIEDLDEQLVGEVEDLYLRRVDTDTDTDF